jgi:hypothetical protein
MDICGRFAFVAVAVVAIVSFSGESGASNSLSSRVADSSRAASPGATVDASAGLDSQ